MPLLPEGARGLEGLEPYGVDENGQNVFFGFRVNEHQRAVLHCSYLMLAETIDYLQAIANEAQQRREHVDPNTQSIEPSGQQPNLVSEMDFDIDVLGQSATLRCKTPHALIPELHLPLNLIEQMYAILPELISEAKHRQANDRQRYST